MDDTLKELRHKAQEVVGQFQLGHEWFSAGMVGAALRTASGKIYTGICIDLPSGMGFCAEHSAVAEMLKHREKDIVEIVAVSEHDVLPPCGRCREMLMQVSPKNADTVVVLPGERTARLEELLPERWVPGEAGSV